MAANLEAIPGTSDIWEPECSEWRLAEDAARSVFSRYGYSEVRTPVFERTDVFVRGIGGDTDVVQKEMYTFEDRGGRSLTLRPEGTAGVMRAIARNGLNEGDEKRVFYLGPMFRGERPAAGRRRQFHQVGVEAVGSVCPGMDAENIAMLMDYLDNIGIRDAELHLNTRGVAEDRVDAELELHRYFSPLINGMCADCQRRLQTNIWRILDCKAEACQAPIQDAPPMLELLGTPSRDYFKAVRATLDSLHIPYIIDNRLVRGLDYYVHTVFEVVHSGLGAQNAIAGGGRYQLHLPGLKRPLCGVGFAAGLERLLLTRQALEISPAAAPLPQIMIVCHGDETLNAGLSLGQELRRHGFRVLAELAGRSMKAQMRAANRNNVRIALILGENEIQTGSVQLKDLRESTQEELPRSELDSRLRQIMAE